MSSFEIKLADKTVTVTGKYIRPSRGARDSLGGRAGAGPALEPDEPGDFEIESILDENGVDITAATSDEDIEAIVDEAVRIVEEDQEPDEPDWDYPDDHDHYDYNHPTY